LNRESGEFEHSMLSKIIDKIVNNAGYFSIFTIYEDKQGIIWIGTSEGLIQYNRITDQYIHYTYDPENPQSLADYQVRAIAEDTRGIFGLGMEALH
jgi:ligand-binding sensor domain-containing protein